MLIPLSFCITCFLAITKLKKFRLLKGRVWLHIQVLHKNNGIYFTIIEDQHSVIQEREREVYLIDQCIQFIQNIAYLRVNCICIVSTGHKQIQPLISRFPSSQLIFTHLQAFSHTEGVTCSSTMPCALSDTLISFILSVQCTIVTLNCYRNGNQYERSSNSTGR